MKSFIELLTEDKTSIINKLKNLSKEEKEIVIDFFSKHAGPHYENQIDWNNKNLTFQDFQTVMSVVSKTKKEKSVKRHGIAGLKEGTDFIEMDTHNDEYVAYIPLTYEASVLIASNKVGNKCEAKWCTAYQKDKQFWITYTSTKRQLPIYVIGRGNKYAVMVEPNNKDYIVWDEYDNNDNENIPGIKSIKDSLINPYAHMFNAIRDKHLVMKHFVYEAIIKDAVFKIDDRDKLTWTDGTWVSGKWYDGKWLDGKWITGIWKGGIWVTGTWNNGIWERGVWKDGYWYDGNWQEGEWRDGEWLNGQWHNGVWQAGNWNNGTWYDGIWKNGLWKAGTWYGGKWEKGAWMGGYDKNGVFHDKGDSPNKWKL